MQETLTLDRSDNHSNPRLTATSIPSSAWVEINRETSKEHFDSFDTPLQGGLNQAYSESLSVDAAFGRFIDEAILEPIVISTNDKQAAATCSVKFSNAWERLTVTELQAYIGVIAMMGVDRKPTIDMHWTRSQNWDSQLVKESFSRTRFRSIGKWLRLCSPAEAAAASKLGHLYKYIRARSQTLYIPHKSVSVAKTSIPLRSWRSRKAQVFPRENIGEFKVLSLTESYSGYVHNFLICKPKEQIEWEARILTLIDSLPHKDLHVYASSNLATVALAETLLKQRIAFTGNIKKHRAGLPASFTEKAQSLRETEAAFWRKGQVLLCAWRNKHTMAALSNYYSASVLEVNCQGKAVKVPALLQQCSQNMRGLDLFEQRLRKFGYPHKFDKWWKNGFVFFVEVALHNAFILFKEGKETPPSYVEFRVELAERLTQCQRASRMKPPIEGISADNHTLVSLVPSKRCSQCLLGGVHSNTGYFCSQCQVPLHKRCFLSTHHK